MSVITSRVPVSVGFWSLWALYGHVFHVRLWLRNCEVMYCVHRRICDVLGCSCLGQPVLTIKSVDRMPFSEVAEIALWSAVSLRSAIVVACR